MPKRLCIIATPALLGAGCVHERPEVYYLCQAMLTNENGAFHILAAAKAREVAAVQPETSLRGRTG
jgi:hypothetical protein